jgi:hypothetical protein
MRWRVASRSTVLGQRLKECTLEECERRPERMESSPVQPGQPDNELKIKNVGVEDGERERVAWCEGAEV